MKGLHFNIAQAVITGLTQIFDENKYADKVIEKILRSNPKWGSRDRKFIAETIYEIVRWHRLLKFVLEPSEDIIVSHWQTLGAWFVIQNQELPKWNQFETIDSSKILDNLNKAKAIRAVKESIPEWMDLLALAELGENIWARELSFLNQQASVVLRVNTLKISKKELQSEFKNQEVDTVSINGFPDALVLERRQNVFQLPQFKNGLFEVQDAGSQLIAEFLEVHEGMRVIDACAGAGGKALHLAAMMRNKGKLIALDTEAWKLEELKKRAKRGGVFNIETRPIEGSKTIKRLEESADRLLLDVPCSGLGVLRRNPDAKWKLNPQFINNIHHTQQEILEKYSKMLKVGGQLVYATCSILPSENRAQVDKFISKSPLNYRFIEERIVLPSEGFDGFYMARMERLA